MKQDLNDLAYFVHVVDHGGFAPAGRVLGEPKSKLSRRIAALEARLGVQLITRSTRQFAVTELGQNYYRHCRAMLVEADAAQEAIDLTRVEPCGTVNLTCPVGMLHANVAQMLTKFMTAYPQVEVHLEATDRRVDPIAEAIDLAIRVRRTPLEDSSLRVRSLGERKICLLASPELIKQQGKPDDPLALTTLPSLGHGRPHATFEWVLHSAEQREARVRHRPRFITLDMAALRSACVAGIGILQLPQLLVRNELHSGALIDITPHGWSLRPETIHIVFASQRGMLLSVRTLIDFLVAGFNALDDE